MSGLFTSLNAAVKALNAHSHSIEIVGKNLANVNNPAYARQRVLYGDRGTVMTPQGAVSLGLEALGVQQLRDALLDRQLMREIGLKASFLAEQSGNQRAQAALGQNIDRLAATTGPAAAGSHGLAAALDDFFNGFQSFAASPTDQGERQMLLQKAGILTDRFHLADQRLAQVQSDLAAEVSTDVAQINRLLATLAELNTQIGRFEVNAPGSAVDLRDQRQARLEELSALMPVELRDTAGGQLQIALRDDAGNELILVDLATVRSTVSFDGQQLTAGDPPVVIAVSAGSIKGALTARDGAIQTLRDDLDSLARQLVTAVNGAYNPDGVTGDFFNASGTTAAAITVRSNLTAASLRAGDGDAAGDNSRALELAGLATMTFSTAEGDAIDGTFTGFFSQTVSKLGQALAGATSRVEDQASIERLVRSQRDSVSGTSMDEEIADLMKYQRAFQASSRVFNVMDELLDLVVNRLGRL
jgi:flagellar hook-associated protein 1